MKIHKVCNDNNRHNYLQKMVFKKLQKIEKGEIIWHEQQMEKKFGTSSQGLKATVTIHHKNFYKKFLWRGSLGLAESYMEGDWSCDNLTVLMQIIIANETTLLALEKGWSFTGHIFRMLRNMISYSPIKKSRKNILYHYDLSNDFFKLFLDRKMMYSSAVFDNSYNDLERAQTKKLSLVCEQLQLKQTDHLLEIGTGWGALAIYAVQNYQCKVTTTTISDAQYEYVSNKIKALNLEKNICLLKKDYRDLQGKYDKLVSIEMIESIGYKYFNKYFSVCDQLLKPGGLFLLQSIIINDQEYQRYKREIDFIKVYIFPGGCLPCIATISHSIKKNTTMRIKAINDFGQDYATTLSHWHKRFTANEKKIKQLGFDDKFMRMFKFYFCYCEAGFLSSYISVIHTLMEKNNAEIGVRY